MLDLFCRRAGLQDGMRGLELGCAWGSFCLWIAEKYPTCSVLAVSNSRTQREYLCSRCRELGLRSVDVGARAYSAYPIRSAVSWW